MAIYLLVAVNGSDHFYVEAPVQHLAFDRVIGAHFAKTVNILGMNIPIGFHDHIQSSYISRGIVAYSWKEASDYHRKNKLPGECRVLV